MQPGAWLESPLLAGVFAGLLVVTGVIDAFFGYKLFKVTAALLLGTLLGAVAAWLAAEVFSVATGLTLAAAGGGFLAGLLLARLVIPVALAVLGTAGAAAAVLPLVPTTSEAVRWLILLALSIGLSFLCFRYSRLMIKGVTALTGGLRVSLGVGFFTTGDRLLLGHYLEPQWIVEWWRVHPDYLIGAVGLAAAGFLFQAFVTK